MFGEITIEIMLLMMLYAVGATMAAVACLYLVFRRGNAFTRRISTPKRLRQWTAAFFGIVALGHLWYLPGTMMADGDAAALWMLIGARLHAHHAPGARGDALHAARPQKAALDSVAHHGSAHHPLGR